MDLFGSDPVHQEIADKLIKVRESLSEGLTGLTNGLSEGMKAEISLQALAESNALLTAALKKIVENAPREAVAPPLAESSVLFKPFEPLEPKPEHRAINAAINSLRRRYQIETYGDLLQKDHDTVKWTKGVGTKGFTDLVAHLEGMGLTLGQKGKPEFGG